LIELKKFARIKRYKKTKIKMLNSLLIKEADKLKMEGKHLEAVKLCEKIIINDLDNTEAYEELGDNYLSLKEYEKAEKALKYGLKLKTDSPNGYYLLGFLYSCLGEWHLSIENLEKADSLEHNHPEILRCLGWAYFHCGNRKRGLIVMERALNLNQNDCLVLCDLAICYLHEKNFDRTIQLLNEAIAIEPDNKKVQQCLKTALFFKKEHQQIHQK